MRAFPNEIKGLTSLRFFAAIWVVFCHFVFSLPAGPKAHYMIISQGDMSVDFFFILSGFILFHAHKKQVAVQHVPFFSFYTKRLARIYPMHLVTLLYYVVILVGTTLAGKTLPNPERYDPSQLVLNLFLVHAWQVRDAGAFNYPSWSVSAEWFAYLLFPIIAITIFRGRTKERSGLILIGALVFFIGIWLLCPTVLGHKFEDLHSNFGYVRILPEFILGMAVYNFCSFHQLAFLGRSWVAPALCMAILAFAALQLDRVFVVIAFTALIASVAESSCKGQSGFLALPALVYLGEISYSIYMVHSPVGTMVFQAFGFLHRPITPFAVVFAAGITVAVASLTYRFIEIPGRNWVREILGDRQRVAPKASNSEVTATAGEMPLAGG